MWTVAPIPSSELVKPTLYEIQGARGCQALYLPPGPSAVAMEVYTDSQVQSSDKLPVWSGSQPGLGFPPYAAGALTIHPGQCIQFSKPVEKVHVRATPWSGWPVGGSASNIRTPYLIGDSVAYLASDTLLAGYASTIPIMVGAAGDVVLPGSQEVPQSLTLMCQEALNSSGASLGAYVQNGWTGTAAASFYIYAPDTVVMPGVARRYRRLILRILSVEAGAVTLGSLSMQLHYVQLQGRGTFAGQNLVNIPWGCSDPSTIQIDINLGSASEWLDSSSGFTSILGQLFLSINGGTASRTIRTQLILDMGEPDRGAIKSKMQLDAISAWTQNTHHIGAIPTGRVGEARLRMQEDSPGWASANKRRSHMATTQLTNSANNSTVWVDAVAPGQVATYYPVNSTYLVESAQAAGAYVYGFTVAGGVTATLGQLEMDGAGRGAL